MTKYQIGYIVYGILGAGVAVTSILAYWFRRDGVPFPTLFRTVKYLQRRVHVRPASEQGQGLGIEPCPAKGHARHTPEAKRQQVHWALDQTDAVSIAVGLIPAKQGLGAR